MLGTTLNFAAALLLAIQVFQGLGLAFLQLGAAGRVPAAKRDTSSTAC